MRTAAAVALVLSALLAGCAADRPSTTPPPSAGSSPSPEETTGPQAAAPSEPVPDPVRGPVITRLLVVGDLMLGRGVAAAGRPGRPVRPLRFLAGRIGRADIAVGNLESTLSNNGRPQQDPPTDSFAAPPGTLAGLERLGFDVLSLANNHTGDFGEAAFLETLAAFRGREIRQVGAGRDLGEALRPLVVRHRGVRFGFLAFNAIGETPAAAPDSPGVLQVRMPPRTGAEVDDGDLRRVTGAVRRLDRRVDAVVVLPHWGDQYVHRPVPAQSVVGRALVAAGADLVVGGHPHWVQGLEPVGRAVIAHSLGNAVFDMDFDDQVQQGMTLTATFRDDRLVDLALGPYRIDPTDWAPRPVRGAEAAEILADVREHSAGRFARRLPVRGR